MKDTIPREGTKMDTERLRRLADGVLHSDLQVFDESHRRDVNLSVGEQVVVDGYYTDQLGVVSKTMAATRHEAVAAQYLGLTEDEVRAKLKSGASFAQLASQSVGKTPEGLTQAWARDFVERRAVAERKWTEANGNKVWVLARGARYVADYDSLLLASIDWESRRERGRNQMRQLVEAEIASGWTVAERGDDFARLYYRRRWGADDTVALAVLGLVSIGLLAWLPVVSYLQRPGVVFRTHRVTATGDVATE